MSDPLPASQTRPLSVVLLVIGTMAGVVWLYAVCLFIVSIWSRDAELQAKAIEMFKDFGIYAAGALSGFLARTSVGGEGSAPVTITNPPEDPVPTTETKNPPQP